MRKGFSSTAAILVLALSIGCQSIPDATVHLDGSGDANVDFVVNRFFDKIPAEGLPGAKPSELFVIMQLLSMVGREDLNDHAIDKPGGGRICDVTDSAPSDILAELRSRASSHRVVIINEAHDQPQHRDFIRRLAMVLWDDGYRVYAAETFSPFVAQSSSFSYTRTNDGYYSNEPVFGELIREAKRVGYRLAPYEHSVSSADTKLSQHERAAIREEGQANNLAAIIADLDDGERLLVHAGYSHAAEVPIASFGGKNLKWMAARLRDKTGIDPLTIDQTVCVSADKKTHLLKDAGRVVHGQFDIQVAHPSVDFVRGRPQWRQSDSLRRVSIPRSLIDLGGRVIVEVRPQGDTLNSVPADRLMVWPGDSHSLLLPPGNYDVVSFREDGAMLKLTESLVVR